MLNTFFSPLASIVSVDQIPENLDFVSDGLEVLLESVYYRDL